MLILVVLAGALVSGVWLVLGGGATTGSVAVEGPQRAAVAQVERGGGGGELQGFGRGEARARKIREQAAERAVMQQRISEQLARRAAARGDVPGKAEAPDEAKARKGRAGEPAEDEVAPAGQVVDRSGNREYLVKVMNEELIPLADECYAMAREKNPELAGMMAVDVDLVGDEDVGGVVEDVKTSQVNEIKDEGLLECVRESLMAVTLPPPTEGGRDGFMLSMRFAPEE